LKNVGALVAVASCKGGVGKSSVAANLAFALAAKGGRVGLLDLDVYGPSLPTLLRRSTHDFLEAPAFDDGNSNSSSFDELRPVVRRSREHENMVLPVMCGGADVGAAREGRGEAEPSTGSSSSGSSGKDSKAPFATITSGPGEGPLRAGGRAAALPVGCMSFGWVNPRAGVVGAGGAEAAVVRGPVASKVATQLLLGTDWGALDYLIVDCPPGTGDIHLTLSQVQLARACQISGPSLSHAHSAFCFLCTHPPTSTPR
jgi:hypothetical protein